MKKRIPFFIRKFENWRKAESEAENLHAKKREYKLAIVARARADTLDAVVAELKNYGN